MKYEVVKEHHAVGESNFHYQLTPAYRAKIFTDEKVRKLTEAYLRAKAEELHVIIISANFGPDHMHIFVGKCKNWAAAKLVQRFKGYIARVMRRNHRALFSHLLWGKKFWTSGYFYRSVGQATNEAIRYYIEHSQAKHWEVVDYEVIAARSEKQLTL